MLNISKSELRCVFEIFLNVMVNIYTSLINMPLSVIFLLSYHRRMRMISEALELRVEGGQFCTIVYLVMTIVGLVEEGLRWWMVCMRDKGVGRMSEDGLLFVQPIWIQSMVLHGCSTVFVTFEGKSFLNVC